MLILPLHRRLTAANFPYVTALLILINVLVFCGWQSGDEPVLEKAAAYYQHEHIDQYEPGKFRVITASWPGLEGLATGPNG